MPNVCFVKTCPNRKTKNVGKCVRFFTLPEREPERSEWLRRTGQENDGENLPRKPRFCAEHFDSSAFTNGDPTSARLRWSALPKLPKTLEPPQKRPRVQVEASASGPPASSQAGVFLRDCTTEVNIPAAKAAASAPDETEPQCAFSSAVPTCGSELASCCTSPVHSDVPDSDSTWSPSHTTALDRGEQGASSSTPPPPEEERQFLVFESCLQLSMSAAFVRPPKEELVLARRSRFST